LASATARRHGISNQLLFSWRKAYRAGRLGVLAGFVPAMIVSERPEKRTGSGCGRIEIVSANGRRVVVDNDVEMEALLRILRGLETLP
jgi:transposase